MTEIASLFELWQSNQVQFLQPDWFYFLLLVPVLWFAHRVRAAKNDWQQTHRAKSMQFRHSLIDQMGFEPQAMQQSHWLRWVLQGLRVLLLTLLVSALAQPVKIEILPPEPQTKTVRDVVFVVETSVSMVLEDYEVNGKPTQRIEVIKGVLDQFIEGLDGNRFGVVLFGDEAYSLMPLTSDAIAARLMLKRLLPYLAGRTDEGVGAALGLALQQAEVTTSTTKNRIVVLISDGSTRDSTLPLAEAVHYAQGLNIPIYTIGVGANSSEADKRQVSGLLYEALEANSLKQIAQETGGQYHQVGSGADLQKVLLAIDKTEGVAVDAPSRKTKEVALYPTVVALALMVFISYFALLQLVARRLQQGSAA